MTLARLFELHAAPAVAATFAAHSDPDAALLQLHRSGCDAWPQLAVTPEQLTIFLARQLPPEAARPEALSGLRAGELYLLCAFNLRQPAAQGIVQTVYMTVVRRALLERGVAEWLIADIQQELCSRLIEKQDPAVLRRGYAGTGDLGSWLCTVAVREAALRRKRGQRELSLGADVESVLADPSRGPESASLSGDLKQAFHAAFRDALAALSSRERNLLRYHFLQQLSIDQIGTIYHVHRATAARWVTRACDHLIAQTRQCFLQRTDVRAQSLPNVMELVRSQLSINLGSLLRDAVEGDA